MSEEYQVWCCKIIVPLDAELPNGFDAPPRTAAIKAVEDSGIEVVGCSSGWGGSLTKMEREEFNAWNTRAEAQKVDKQEGMVSVPSESLSVAVSLLEGIAARNTASYAAKLGPVIQALKAAQGEG